MVYLPARLRFITRSLHLPPSRVYSTVTFYHFSPSGRRVIIPVPFVPAPPVMSKEPRKFYGPGDPVLGLQAGQATADNKLGVQVARCVGRLRYNSRYSGQRHHRQGRSQMIHSSRKSRNCMNRRNYKRWPEGQAEKKNSTNTKSACAAAQAVTLPAPSRC